MGLYEIIKNSHVVTKFIIGIFFIGLGVSLIGYKVKLFNYYNRRMSEGLRKDIFIRFGNWYVLLSVVIGFVGFGIVLILWSLGIIVPK